MSKKVYVVTGASSGLGKEIAIGIAKQGHQVSIVCRDQARGTSALEDIKQASGSEMVDLFLADLSSLQDVRQLADAIKRQYPSIHCLINNAGVVLTERRLSTEGIEKTLATNHLAPFLLTHCLIDNLTQNDNAKIINISSDIYKWAKLDLNDLNFEHRKYQFMKAYAQSKLLFNIATFEWARRLENKGIMVNAVHPGAVKSNLGRHDNHSSILRAVDYLIKYFFITPKAAAKFPVELATSFELQNVTGQYFAGGKSVCLKPIVHDPDLVQKVWKISESLTGTLS